MPHPNRGRALAQERYPELGACPCGEPAYDRHHIDGNTFNNVSSNMADIDWTRYFSVSTLLERGWTGASIRALLGAPDTVEPNTFNPQAQPMRLYAIERVRRAETSWEWRGWRDHGVDRKIDRYERHRQTKKP